VCQLFASFDASFFQRRFSIGHGHGNGNGNGVRASPPAASHPAPGISERQIGPVPG
jgi:hypothetical protein